MKNPWMLGAVILLTASCTTGTDPTDQAESVNTAMIDAINAEDWEAFVDVTDGIVFEASNQTWEGEEWAELFAGLGYDNWSSEPGVLLDDGNVSIPVTFDTPEPFTVYLVYIFEGDEVTVIDEWSSPPPQTGINR